MCFCFWLFPVLWFLGFLGGFWCFFGGFGGFKAASVFGGMVCSFCVLRMVENTLKIHLILKKLHKALDLSGLLSEDTLKTATKPPFPHSISKWLPSCHSAFLPP